MQQGRVSPCRLVDGTVNKPAILAYPGPHFRIPYRLQQVIFVPIRRELLTEGCETEATVVGT